MHFPGHPHFDAFGLRVADVQRFSQAVRHPVAADVDRATEDQFSLLQDGDKGAFEAQIHQRHHLVRVNLRHRLLERVRRADRARDNLVGDQPRPPGALDIIVHELFPGARDEHPLLWRPRRAFQRVRRFELVVVRQEVAIKDVVGQFLLQIGPRAVFQYQPQILHWHTGHLRVPQQRIVAPQRQSHILGLGMQRLRHRLQMLGEQVHRKYFIENGRIQQGVTA